MSFLKDLLLDCIYTMLFVLLLISISQCAQADPWSPADRWRQGIYTVLHVLDYRQTSVLSDYGLEERNTLLGREPSQGEIDRYFSSTLVLHYVIVDQLPASWRPAFQYVTIGAQLNAVTHNYRVGIRIRF